MHPSVQNSLRLLLLLSMSLQTRLKTDTTIIQSNSVVLYVLCSYKSVINSIIYCPVIQFILSLVIGVKYEIIILLLSAVS